MTGPAFVPLFDTALQAVEAARRSGVRTRDGGDPGEALDRLRAALAAERDAAVARGTVDRTAVGTMVRDVVSWYPDDQVKLLVALGALARA